MATSISVVIDQLSYHYYNGSNKLLNVIDAANDAQTNLGDFHYDAPAKTAATQDYSYDANGNLYLDHNKHLTIAYNYLNLPMQITVTGKGTIKYIYDAAGNKLQKAVAEGTDTSITLYMAGSIYQNDTLQFFSTPEGRVRPVGSSFVYDYFLKDHLGNTRMVITDDYNVSS